MEGRFLLLKNANKSNKKQRRRKNKQNGHENTKSRIKISLLQGNKKRMFKKEWTEWWQSEEWGRGRGEAVFAQTKSMKYERIWQIESLEIWCCGKVAWRVYLLKYKTNNFFSTQLSLTRLLLGFYKLHHNNNMDAECGAWWWRSLHPV